MIGVSLVDNFLVLYVRLADKLAGCPVSQVERPGRLFRYLFARSVEYGQLHDIRQLDYIEVTCMSFRAHRHRSSSTYIAIHSADPYLEMNCRLGLK